MAANNMSNIYVSPDVFSTFMSLQQDNLHKLQQQIPQDISRTRGPKVFCKKAALKVYAEFTRKHLFWSLFSIKLQAGVNFVKKGLQHRYFPVKFTKFLRTPILKNICKRLVHL